MRREIRLNHYTRPLKSSANPDLGRLVVNDLLAALPTLEAINEVVSRVTFDAEEESEFSLILGLISAHSLGMQALLSLLEREEIVLNALREDSSQEHSGLDQDDSES